MKRFLSFVLVFVMLLSLIPAASAAEGDVELINSNGLLVTYGKTRVWQNDKFVDAIPKSDINWQPIGSSGINAEVYITHPSCPQVGATLTFKNTLDVPATLRFEYILDDKADEYADPAKLLDVDGSPVEMELAAGATYTITFLSPSFGITASGANLIISNLSLSAGGDVTATFTPAENGSYTVNGAEVSTETAHSVAAGTTYAVSATADSGYRFFGWHNGKEYISYSAEASIPVNENCTICPVFIKNDVAVFGVGEMRFQSLTEADAYAKNGAIKTIVLMNDGILTGEHTISANNTLLIPYNDANTVHTTATSTAIMNGNLWVNQNWVEPSAYRTLTMAQGAKLTVNGSLNVGGRHSAGPFLTAGSPSGDLGMIQMAEDTNITVAKDGSLYCWGYIYGSGTVTVNDGGTVHENFQFSDFRGGNITLGLAKSFLVFPISQYYVQNIEVATTYASGATEYVWGSVFLQDQVLGTSVKFIGEDTRLCMFVPGANGTVTKTYDPATDRLVIDINGNGSINPMGLELGGTAINTATFALPINSNMTININSGTTDLNQSLALLPGVKLTIAENATLAVKSAEPLKDQNGQYVHYKGSNNLIVYDRDQWFNAYQFDIVNGQPVAATLVEAKFVYTKNGFKRLQPIAWSPTCSYTRTEADLVDAVVDINGKLITEGFIYTTVDVDLEKYLTGQGLEITGGGAAVTSTRGTGTLVMNNGCGQDNITLQPNQNTADAEFAYLPMISARLQNADGEYVDTLGAAPGATYSYCKTCGTWNTPGHTVEITWIVNGEDFTQEVCKGTQPVYMNGNDPEREGYEFIGWSTADDNEPEYTSATLPNADTEATYWACFKEKAGGLKGDVDLDGDVDVNDLTYLAEHVAKISVITDVASLENAEVTRDGEVTVDDLTRLAEYVAKIISSF